MRRRYGLHPAVARASRPMPPAMVSFVELVSNTALVLMGAWSLLFYLSIALPRATHLRAATSISFLLLPLLFWVTRAFYDNEQAGRWTVDRLGDPGWVIAQWMKEFALLVGEILAFFALVTLLLWTLARWFDWPDAVWTWTVGRVTAFVGLPLPEWLCILIGGFYLFAFLFLWTGVLNLARIGAMADVHFIHERVVSPGLYGPLARLLSGSFVLVLLLSVAGATLKAAFGLGLLFGWKLPHLELDLLPEVIRRLGDGVLPAWLPALHLALVATIVRVLLFRLRYAQTAMSLIWSSSFSEVGSFLLALPLFFQIALHELPLGHFFDGYLLVVQCVFAVVYLAYLVPTFVLMLQDRSVTAMR